MAEENIQQPSEGAKFAGSLLKGALIGLAIAAIGGAALTLAPAGMLGGVAAFLHGAGILATASGGAVGWGALLAWGAGLGALLGGAKQIASNAMHASAPSQQDIPPGYLDTQPLTPARYQGEQIEMDNPYYQPGLGAKLAQRSTELAGQGQNR